MRKLPQQARSREMVERIVTAGRQVLVSDGYEGFSTNRVAAAAGVSPGSLYQYFPDKTAILDVVLARYWEATAARVERALGDRIADLHPGDTRPIIDALLAALEADPALLRVISEELPPARLKRQRAELERRIRELTAVSLVMVAGRPRAQAETASWVIVIALEYLASRWVLDQPQIARGEMLDHLTALIGGYVRAPGVSLPGALMGDPQPGGGDQSGDHQDEVPPGGAAADVIPGA